jgi:hypothetical protein
MDTLRDDTYIPAVYDNHRTPLDRKLSHRVRDVLRHEDTYILMLLWRPKVAHQQEMGCRSPECQTSGV